MTMATWDPVRELMTIRRDLDRAMSGQNSPFPWRLGFLPGRGARQYPMLNIYERGDDFYVEALMPGIDAEKLDVTIVGNQLAIAGAKPGPADIAPERIHRMERSAGRFMRSVTLPAEVERDQVNAQYRNGILLLTLPRAETARPHKVTIQEGSAGSGSSQPQTQSETTSGGA